jgi:catechol 2,3-dioxygenase-like lactoylglutathione lyase family enzyme
MFSHVMVGSNDIERSRRFYDALFGAVGAKPGRIDERGRLSYLHKGALFMITRPIDGQPATHGNGSTIGINLDSPEQVHDWHEAGVAAGGTTIEDPPGVRSGSFGPLYLAYLRDPDGNKLCGLHRLPIE